MGSALPCASHLAFGHREDEREWFDADGHCGGACGLRPHVVMVMLESHEKWGVWFPVSSEFAPVVGERTTCFSCGFLGVRGLNVCYGCELWQKGKRLY